jgi:transposase
MLRINTEVAMKAYSMDFRNSVAAARDAGMSTSEVVEVFGCCASWSRRLMQRRHQRGTLEPIQRRQVDQRKIDDVKQEQLRQFIVQNPDATLAELIEALDLKVHPGTLCRRLKVLDLPLKKSPCTPASRTGRMSKSNASAGLSSSVRCG